MHLVHEIWEALEREQLSPRFVVDLAKEHFFSLCPVCAEEFRLFEEGRGRVLPSAAVAAVVLEEQVKRLQDEVRAAQRDIADLLATPGEQRLGKIRRATKRYRGSATVHGLLGQYWEVFYTDPRAASAIAELAWAVAKESHGVPRIHELVALAASHVGNAARAAGDLGRAEDWFTHTRKLLEEHDVRAVTIAAKVDFLEGLLRKDQRRFAEALRLLNRALALYRLAGLRVDVVRTLLSLGATCFANGKIREAARQAQEALTLLDRDGEPRLYLCAQHNLAVYRSEQGQHAEAARILEANQDLYQAHGDRWTTLHRAWLEGRIRAGLGKAAEAEASFLAARDGFLEQGIAYDAALVTLDLAKLYLEQGRLAQVRALAEEIVPVFEAQAIHREALAAWLMFREAADREAVHGAMIRKLKSYLEEARSDPGQRFETEG